MATKHTLKHYTTDTEAVISPYKATKWLPNDMRVVKLRGKYAFKFSPESEGKTRYMIASVNTKGEFKNLGILKQYEAVLQLKELFTNYPKVLSRKAYTPNKDGSMNKKVAKMTITTFVRIDLLVPLISFVVL